MVSNVNNFFVNVDNMCDYIPFTSTLTNLIDLFQKYAVLPFMSTESIVNSHYYTHLEEKAFLRCVILLIPVIGNIIIGIYDFANRYNSRSFTLGAVQQNGRSVESSNEQLRKYRDSVLADVRRNGMSLEYASEELRNDREFMLAAVGQNGLALQYASEQLRNNREFMLAAVQQNGFALEYASEQLREELMRQQAV